MSYKGILNDEAQAPDPEDLTDSFLPFYTMQRRKYYSEN